MMLKLNCIFANILEIMEEKIIMDSLSDLRTAAAEFLKKTAGRNIIAFYARKGVLCR